jgi:RNA polymerase primary sigma factor
LPRKKLRLIRKAIDVCNAEPQAGQDEAGWSLDESVPDSRYGSPDRQTTEGDLLEQILGLLEELPAREAAVLRLRFGLGGEEPLTLHEIGARLGLTRERVRQIEVATLRKLAERAAG